LSLDALTGRGHLAERRGERADVARALNESNSERSMKSMPLTSGSGGLQRH